MTLCEESESRHNTDTSMATKTQKTTSEHFNKLQLTLLYMVSKCQSFVACLPQSSSVFHYVTDKEMENKLLIAVNSGANRLWLKLLFLGSFPLRLQRRVFRCTKRPFVMLSVVYVRSLCPSSLKCEEMHMYCSSALNARKLKIWAFILQV